MIKCNDKNGSFWLIGKNVCYVLRADSYGFLRQLHFGKRIGEEEVEYSDRCGEAIFYTVLDGMESEGGLNHTRLDCSFSQTSDYRRPIAVVKLPNGSRRTDFRYVSHKIHSFHALPGLPCARGGDTLEIILSDALNKLELSLFYTVFDDSDVIARSCKIKNLSDTSVNVEKLSSFLIDLPKADYDAVYLAGSYANETKTYRNAVTPGIFKITSGCRGTSSHCFNPFLALVDKSCDEHKGEARGVCLAYSGCFSLSAEMAETGFVRLQGGIDEDAASWRLEPGEDFYTPQALLSYSDEGIGGMSRAIHDFLRKHFIAPRFVKETRPIVVNNWEATYFDFNTEKLFRIIDTAAELGLDAFVLDDGWFCHRSDDKGGLGDWNEDEQKLTGGLSAVSRRCREKGIKFGLWFEPEMVSEDSELYRDHKEYVLKTPGCATVRGRQQLVLDFANPEVVTLVFNKMKKIIADNGVEFLKWDMNRYLADLYSDYLAPERQCEMAHRYVLGVYSLAKRLTTTFPDLLIEGCSGGGGRFDAGMLYYFPQIWASDNTDAIARTVIQDGLSVCYPYSCVSAHVSVCPNHHTGRSVPFDARYAVASQGVFGYELDISRFSDEEKTIVKKQVESYRKDAPLVINCDLYRLSTLEKNNLWAVAEVSKDKRNARVSGLFGLLGKKTDALPVYGLDEEAFYTVKETAYTASGRSLRESGLPLPAHTENYFSFTYHLQMHST